MYHGPRGVPWPWGVYRGPPDAYRGPCMKNMRQNRQLSFTELSPHLIDCGRGRGLPACQVSFWSIQPYVHYTPTLQRDRQDMSDRETTVRYGRGTVLQTVAQKPVDILTCLRMPRILACSAMMVISYLRYKPRSTVTS